MSEQASGGIWADVDELDADWRPPSRLSLVPRWVKVLTPVVALVVTLGLVQVLGGFRPAKDTETRLPLGSTIITGNAAFTPRQAHWHWRASDKAWKVSVSGSCQYVATALDAPEVPSYRLADAMYLGRPHTRDVSTDTLVNLGEGVRGASFTDYSSLTPGAPPIPCAAEFDFEPHTAAPESEVTLMVFDLTYRSEDLSQQGGATWLVGSHVTTMRVPAVITEPVETES